MYVYSHVLRMEDDHALKRTLDFEIEDQRKKGGRKGHGRVWLKWHIKYEM